MRTFTVLLTALFLTLFTSPLLAAENYSDLMNRAGMQRMLSQRIAKAYLYNGQGISQQEASHQLNIAVTRFEYNHAALKKINDSATQELLGLVESIFSSYKSLVTKPYKKENSATVLELSEQLLEVSQNVVLKLQELSGAKIDDIINLSGRQRMLSQRIAKYYIAYQAGFQDENSVQQLETAVSEFQAALKLLTEEKRNTERINLLLHKMQMLWERVAPYFLKIREKGNPSLVLTSTDDINQLADEVTALYVEVSAAAAKNPSR
ncbi:MAG: type IV pili methyl-accepting chemotaxis transducer N-terminal domain-containing protein [Candidatus Electronema sp. V4]|uniref:type IV pili methyl-accepting chemotaxis transducer N-terminal domain-containing protein n=1 Tax=Candidatus Electronema sp. V4 TaxID=3454756 RepID=UPI0040558982